MVEFSKFTEFLFQILGILDDTRAICVPRNLDYGRSLTKSRDKDLLDIQGVHGSEVCSHLRRSNREADTIYLLQWWTNKCGRIEICGGYKKGRRTFFSCEDKDTTKRGLDNVMSVNNKLT